MKKVFYIYFLATIVAGSLISCQEEDLGHTKEEIKASAYAKKFIEDFGEPDPNHTWGFINQPVLNYTIPSTRTVNTESNLWGDPNYYGLNVPPVVTEEEAEYVYNWFLTHQFPDGEVVHWSDFFIQYVAYSGIGSMDQLGYESMSGDWEHVNDFNTNTNSTKYVYNAGTENWTYRASHSNTYQYNKYNIQHLVFTVNGHHYDGWYIGLDYESLKGDAGDKHADGYFNDWIVKITPGTHQGYPITVRVMCEDLGNSFDWDFNDVVFDVTFKTEEIWWPVRQTKYWATIILQAVGGTLPIYVGTTDEQYEAHNLLGDGTMTPILSPEAPAVYTLELNPEGMNPNNNVPNAKLIPIYVDGINVTAKDLVASNVPQRFACPDYVMWSPELTNICNTYPNFPAWVQQQDFTDVQNLWNYNPHKEDGEVVVNNN